ncbi:MAG: hypothetical protein OXE87_13180 [Chloroflexi bacterium]|nr:hypothetical protein [Chloroflexota bacterium]
MAKSNIDMDRIAHGAAPSMLAELRQAITDFKHSPNLVVHCAILAAFLCLGLGSAFLAWGIAQSSKILVWTGLSWFMLSFALWAGLGIVALWMLRSLVTVVVREMRRQP